MDLAQARWKGPAGHGLLVSMGLATAMHLVLLLPLRPREATAPVRSSAMQARIVRLPGDEAGSSQRKSAESLTAPAARSLAPPALVHVRNTEAPVAAGDAEYLPAERLAQRPAALIPIEIRYPDVRGQGLVTTVVLTLFINERGTVDFIELDDPNVPAAFAGAARSAFELATFDPGRDGIRPVKSRMRVEVRFDSDEGIQQDSR
jgi:hypothetical protein